MSLDTWKAEFYPVPAAAAAKDGEIASVDHSILKWSGLSAESLKKHNVQKTPYSVSIGDQTTDSRMWVDQHTCALCQLTVTDDGCVCEQCPVFMATGTTCDDSGAYHAWLCESDPRPMQRMLDITREYLMIPAPDAQ